MMKVKRLSDLDYSIGDLYTRFYPNTPEGENAWREMAKNDGVAAVLNIHATAVISQLRSAGYTVTMARKSKQSIESILEELNA